ncbi:MAG: TetR/AcrR family transcriptional regulator [Bacilli bacterium]|nr:TetR/AcrR family transcriptional regulator [Bacilli bacterium]
MNELDPRVQKTKKHFKEAFKKLILDYDDYLKITVKELCDTAGFNRRTFYLHYKQLDDIFVELQEEAIKGFYQRVRGINLLEDVETVVRAFFDLNESNPVYQKINSTDTYFYTKELSRKRALILLKEKEMLHTFSHLDPMVQSIVFKHYHMSVSSMYGSWIKTKRAMPKEDMIQLITNLIKNGVSSLKNNEYHD